VDPASGLVWTKKENGYPVNWQDATDYCRRLQMDGNSNWRLPTIDEHEGIYDAKARSKAAFGDFDVHVKGNIEVSTNRTWSSSPVDSK
jgi:hypothetical protein